MLSIGQPCHGTSRAWYYLDLAREDYYVQGGEPPGKWFGRGADELQLKGEVEPKDFLLTIAGMGKDGSDLTQNTGIKERKRERISGWDLTFSAPKTYSALWALAPEEQRKKLQEIQQKAVEKALSYLEREAAWTRRGHAGREHERASIVVSTFEHGTSRAQDPQLHTHCYLHNITVREDGTTGSLYSKPIYEHKMAAGAVYRAELASRLQKELGFEVEREKDSFRIKGISEDLTKHWSKRREQVLKQLKERKLSGPVASAFAALDTRQAKDVRPRQELFLQWEKEGLELGFSTPEVEKLLEQGRRQKIDLEQEKKLVVDRAIEVITQRMSYFPERDLVRFSATEAQGRGLLADDVFDAVKERLRNGKEIVSLGCDKQREVTYYTTKEILDLERRILEIGQEGKGKLEPIKKEILDDLLSRDTKLTQEQKRAVEHVCGADAVSLVVGMPGTGKSLMLDKAREAWEREGLTVYGAALSGKAARGLAESASIGSRTVHSLLRDIEKRDLKLNSKSVLVIDEAAMVGNRQLEKLLSEASKAEARLVLVGDHKQLQAIELGGAFKALSTELEAAELTEIKRQRETWAREIVYDFAYGEARRGLEELAKRNRLFVEETRELTFDKLISDWASDGGSRAPDKNLIFCASNDEVRLLNEKAQAARLGMELLGENHLYSQGTLFFENDRVLFTRNSSRLEVANGDLATIKKVDEEKQILLCVTDAGKEITVRLDLYDNVKLGYALTTHKSQGVTIDHSYVLSGNEMQDREMTTVQMSRNREGVKLYLDRDSAGEELSDISRQMSKSHQKELALTMLEKVQGQEREAPKKELKFTGLARDVAEQLDVFSSKLTREINGIEDTHSKEYEKKYQLLNEAMALRRDLGQVPDLHLEFTKGDDGLTRPVNKKVLEVALENVQKIGGMEL